MIGAIKDKSREPDARGRLLSAALELFTRKGYAATSVREVVEIARVTKPVLYYYFGNKEGIYLELMRGPYQAFDALLDAWQAKEKTARELIVHLCESVFDLFLENLDTARLMYSIYYGPPQGAPFFDYDEYHKKLQSKVQTLVEQGIGSGEFTDVDAGDAMWIIVGVLSVAMEEQLCSQKPGIDRKRLDRMLAIVLGGIACGKQRLK